MLSFAKRQEGPREELIMNLKRPIPNEYSTLKSPLHAVSMDFFACSWCSPRASYSPPQCDCAVPRPNSGRGKFVFPLTKDLSVGYPSTCRVEPVKRKKWVIVYPCDLRSVRKDSLPAVGGEPISIIAALWGRSQLKQEYSPGCIIEELSSEFQPITRSTGRQTSSLSVGGPPPLTLRRWAAPRRFHPGFAFVSDKCVVKLTHEVCIPAGIRNKDACHGCPARDFCVLDARYVTASSVVSYLVRSPGSPEHEPSSTHPNRRRSCRA